MNLLPKNWWCRSKSSFVAVLLLVSLRISGQEIGNYVNNGSFEDYVASPAAVYPISSARYWISLDSASCHGGGWVSKCNNRVPNMPPHGNQWPKSGFAMIGIQLYNKDFSKEGYAKNRLKKHLSAGRKYCVTFFVNAFDSQPRSVDGLGLSFGNENLDTINVCNGQLTYFTPQVYNPAGNLISDTTNWAAISGTFVADGSEKYIVIGNFLSDSQLTIKTMTSSPFVTLDWSAVFIDDVSCIEVDLPAYAGPDKVIVPGDSTYIGRQRDFAIDPGCRWYRLPDMIPMDTTSGLWVKPLTTTTYVVRQELECSAEKWDTVTVHVNLVGLEKVLAEKLTVYPSPAKDKLVISVPDGELYTGYQKLEIKDNIGRSILTLSPDFGTDHVELNVSELAPGSYFLTLSGTGKSIIVKRVLIAR